MPSAANLVIQDHVPADFTFNPIEASQKATRYHVTDKSVTVLGRPTLAIFRRMNGDNTTRTVELRLAVPVETTDSTTGLVTVNSTLRSRFNFVLPTALSVSDFNRIFALSKDLLMDATVNGVVVNDATFY